MNLSSVYDKLDSNYESDNHDLGPAVRLAQEEGRNLEEIVVGYIREKLKQGNEKLAREFAEDYKTLVNELEVNSGEQFKEIYQRLEQD